MFSLEIRSRRLFALGTAFVLSLISISITLAIIAFAQGDAPRTMPRSPQEEVTLRVEPAASVVENGETFRIYIAIEDAVDLGGFQFVIDYDPAIIEVLDTSNPVELGPFLLSTGRSENEHNVVDSATGVITYWVATTGNAPGPDGDGMLASVGMRTRALGTTALDLKDVEVTDTGGNIQNVSTGNGLVIVTSSPVSAVSIDKSVDPPTAAPEDLLTYTIQRSFSSAGQHSYEEIVFDPIPSGTLYWDGSATLNGLPAPALYSDTIDAIYYQHNDVFTDTDQWTLTFQVQVGSAPSGTLIFNTVTEAVRFDGAAYVGPHTGICSATVECTAPAAPALSTPTIGGSTCDTTPHFSWSSVSDADSYRIQADDDASFSSPEIDTTTSNPEYTPASALLPGTYHWHVRASNTCVAGPWSATWVFTINHCIYLPITLRNY